MSYSRSLESNRLEIVLIAAGILVLVSILGILILMGVGLEPPPPHQDAENCQRATAWGGTWIEREDVQTVKPYSDEMETFIDSVRRKSKSLADEVKHELSNLKRGFTVSGGSPAERLDKDIGITDKLRKFSLDNAVFAPRRQSDPEMGCEDSCNLVESFVSVTGREDEIKGHRRKSSRATRNAAGCDLEGLHFGNSPV